MELKDFVAISGKPGLFKLVSQGKNLVIVENLETGQRLPAHAASRISSLEEIAVFTDTEDKPLQEVLISLYGKEQGKPCLDPKKATPNELRDYFASVLPNYDRIKVYLSDIVKLLTWYNILVTTNPSVFTEPAPEEAPSQEEPVKPEG